jgi:F420-non-reducing hydrogenase large subunit
MIEMAFRAFDPCCSCATHLPPGRMPLTVEVYKGGRALAPDRAMSALLLGP